MLSSKYRPKSLDEVIGQEKIVKSLREMLKTRKIPHLLFTGPPGCGKTSTAYAFAKELDYPVVELNASDERKIEHVRERIKPLAFSTGRRVILLDEADQLGYDAQHALRRIMEKCTKDVRFILTCNKARKLIDAIKSRCAVFYFEKLSDADVLKVVLTVLRKEIKDFKLTPEVKQGLVELVRYVNGDLRKALNTLETIITSKQEISLDTVRLQIPPEFAKEILETALEGHWQEALRKLEDAYVINHDAENIVEQLWQGILNADTEDYIKWKLFEKLSEVEMAIRMGCNPLIQLAGFLSVVWVSRFVPK